MLQRAVAIYSLINVEVQFQYVKKSTLVWYERQTSLARVFNEGFLHQITESLWFRFIWKFEPEFIRSCPGRVFSRGK